MPPQSFPLRKGYVDGPTGQIHYRTFGEGEPLFLIHQSPLSGRQYEAAYPYLAAAGLQVIAMDTPGYGMSDTPKEDPTIATYANVIPSVLDHFGIEKAAVVGHHTGACIAVEVANLFPERVSRVILHGVPVYRDHEREEMMGRISDKELEIREDGYHLLEPWRRRLKVTIGWTHLGAMTRNVVESLVVRDRYWLGFHAAFSYDMWNRMLDLTVPGMILTNTGEDLYLLSRRARKIRPDYTYTEIEGGTHDIVDEKPEEWTNAVVAYLRGPAKPLLPREELTFLPNR